MMTPHQFIALAIRLFAIWLVLTAVQTGLFAYTLRGATQYGGEASMGLVICYMLVAAILWHFPMGVAGRLLAETSNGSPVQLSATELVTVAFVAAGLLIIALKALTPVMSYVSLLIMLISTCQAKSLLVPGAHADGVAGIVMLIIGSTFILKSRALAQCVVRHG